MRPSLQVAVSARPHGSAPYGNVRARPTSLYHDRRRPQGTFGN